MTVERLTELFEEVKAELRSIDIPIAIDEELKLKIITKGQGPGYCSFEWGLIYDVYNIEIHEKTIQGDDVDEDLLKCLLAHELIHTCDGAMPHNDINRELSKKVLEKLGYNPMTHAGRYEYRNKKKKIKLDLKCPCGAYYPIKDPNYYKRYVKDVLDGKSERPCHYCKTDMHEIAREMLKKED